MPSSTSSSEARRARQRRAAQATGTFALTFGLLWVVGDWLAHSTSVFTYASLARHADQLPPGDWYLENGTEMDGFSMLPLYYGVGESIEYAAEADLMLLGSSLTQFAFPAECLQPWCEERGLGCFNLAFEHNEPLPLPRAVMERNDLRPSLVIANAHSFFRSEPSGNAAWLMDSGPVFGLVRRLEAHLPGLFHLDLAPHFIPPAPERSGLMWGRADRGMVYRSIQHGGWYLPALPEKRAPLRPNREKTRPTAEEIRLAADFRDWLGARGGQLVLTSIPSGETDAREAGAKLAEELGVPFLLVDLPVFLSFDDAHLAPESGAEFCRAALEQVHARDLVPTPGGD